MCAVCALLNNILDKQGSMSKKYVYNMALIIESLYAAGVMEREGKITKTW